MVALWEGRALLSTQGAHQTDAISAAVNSTLPRTAPDQGSIPRELHLQVQPRTNGKPIKERGIQDKIQG
eukprot:12882333-Prorocentrum_lima.AAC.1